MPKENIQFTAYAMASERVKQLIETFSDQYEVDMHEWEKNLFALAYERGYSDGKYDYKQSLLKDEEK